MLVSIFISIHQRCSEKGHCSPHAIVSSFFQMNKTKRKVIEDMPRYLVNVIMRAFEHILSQTEVFTFTR